MLENINSGADYAQIIIDKLMEAESEMPTEQQSPIDLLGCWTECIQNKADETYQDYITGKRETYLFTEDEFIKLREEAMGAYVQVLLNNMVDKDVLEVSVDEEGNIMYGLSENGRDLANSIFNNKNNNDESL